MRERFDTYTLNRPRLKKVVGWFLVVFGFLALITPLTPGGLLFFVGLEILGLRLVFTNKLRAFFSRKPILVPIAEDTSKEVSL